MAKKKAPTRVRVKVKVQSIIQFDSENIIAADTRLQINKDTTLQEWIKAGRKLICAEKNIQWLLGEWWNHGHKKWERDADEFLQKIGYARKTLRNYGSTCNKIQSSLRRDDLSFGHHQIVASQEPAEQKQFLKQAKDNNWTVSQLRKAVKEEGQYKETNDGEPKPFDKEARGDRLCDWLRAELDKWPKEYREEAGHWVRTVLEQEFRI